MTASVPEPVETNKPTAPSGWPGGLSLLLLVLVAYLPAFWVGFVWDDFAALHENPLLKDPRGLLQIWTTHGLIPNESHYWPMVYTTYWVEYQLWGLAPVGYHLVNLALHGGAVLLLWDCLRRLRFAGAWVAAALFAVHPVHVESVIWIIERKDVLSLLFYLLSVRWYLLWREGRTRRDYGLSLLFFVLGMLSKSIVISLPFALLLLAWWQRGRITRREFRSTLPFFAVALALGILDTRLAMKAEGFQSGLEPAQRVVLAASALWFYIWKIFIPHPLVHIYAKWDMLEPAWWRWLLIPAGAVLLAVLFAWRERIGRGSLAAALFFCVSLGPVLGLVDFTYMEHSWVADRFVYLASIAPMMLIAWLIVRSPRSTSAAVLLFLLGSWGALTFHNARLYKDIPTLFGHVVYHNPGAHAAHTNLGAYYLAKGDTRRARMHLELSVALHPGGHEGLRNIAVLELTEGNVAKAAGYLREAIAAGAPYSSIRNDLAWILATSPDEELRSPAEALELATSVAEGIGAHSPAVLDTFAAALAANGGYEEAIAAAEKARSLALAADDRELAADISRRLALYRAGMPFIDNSLK